MTMEFIDGYWIWSMNGFYEKLRDDLARYGQSLTEALEKDKGTEIKLYLRMIKDTRQIIEDISDMDVGDFARLVTSKYLGIPE